MIEENKFVKRYLSIEDDILPKLKGVTGNGNPNWRALCPSHDDHDPSLDLRYSTDEPGKPLIYCHACKAPYSKILADLGIIAVVKKTQSPKVGIVYSISRLWEIAEPVIEHPYLAKKHLEPVESIRHIDHKTAGRVLMWRPKNADSDFEGDLLMMLEQNLDGELIGAQFIDSEGRKSWTPGPRKGLCSFWSPGPPDSKLEAVYIAEGFATAASFAVSTGHYTVAAMASNRIAEVGNSFRAKFKGIKLYVLGEHKKDGSNDEENIKQAGACGAKIIMPPEGYGDFNDVFVESGPQAVSDGLLISDPASALNSKSAYTEAKLRDLVAYTVRDELRYMMDVDSWYKYDGMRWVKEYRPAVKDYISKIFIANEVEPKHHSYAAITSVEKLSQGDERLRAYLTAYDSEDYVINTPDGVVDLRTGAITPHSPYQLHTKITNVGPSSDSAPSGRWIRFLEEVTGNDQELMRYLQILCGYLMTGCTHKHIIVFLYGTGRNGKSVFIETIQWVLGEYSGVADMDMFLASPYQKHASNIATLMGRRTAVAQEVNGGQRFDEAKIKRMSGGDRMTAQFMRQDWFEFDPHFKIIIVGNHKPELRNIDEAMVQRLHMVPFTRTFREDEQDPYLREKLREPGEAAFIIRWMLEGANIFFKEGLKRPGAVAETTREYFADQNVFSDWVNEHCIFGPMGTAMANNLIRHCKWYHDALGYNSRHINNRSFKELFLRHDKARNVSVRHERGGSIYTGVSVDMSITHD